MTMGPKRGKGGAAMERAKEARTSRAKKQEPKTVTLTLDEAMALEAAVIGNDFDTRAIDSALKKIGAAKS